MLSNLFKINWRDIGNAVLIAVLAPIIAGVSIDLNAGRLPTPAELQVLLMAGLSAGPLYLLKNFLSNSSGQLLKQDNTTTKTTSVTISNPTAVV